MASHPYVMHKAHGNQPLMPPVLGGVRDSTRTRIGESRPGRASPVSALASATHCHLPDTTQPHGSHQLILALRRCSQMRSVVHLFRTSLGCDPSCFLSG